VLLALGPDHLVRAGSSWSRARCSPAAVFRRIRDVGSRLKPLLQVRRGHVAVRPGDAGGCV